MKTSTRRQNHTPVPQRSQPKAKNMTGQRLGQDAVSVRAAPAQCAEDEVGGGYAEDDDVSVRAAPAKCAEKDLSPAEKQAHMSGFSPRCAGSMRRGAGERRPHCRRHPARFRPRCAGSMRRVILMIGTAPRRANGFQSALRRLNAQRFVSVTIPGGGWNRFSPRCAG